MQGGRRRDEEEAKRRRCHALSAMMLFTQPALSPSSLPLFLAHPRSTPYATLNPLCIPSKPAPSDARHAATSLASNSFCSPEGVNIDATVSPLQPLRRSCPRQPDTAACTRLLALPGDAREKGLFVSLPPSIRPSRAACTGARKTENAKEKGREDEILYREAKEGRRRERERRRATGLLLSTPSRTSR